VFTKNGIFTTVVNMDSIVNIIASIQREIQDSGVTLRVEGDHVRIIGPAGAHCLQIVRLYRPSTDDVKREASPNVVLVLDAASRMAIHTAMQHNHILVSGGGYRIVAPGIALIRDAMSTPFKASRQVRLTGRTGVIVESLLLGGREEWSIRDLAANAGVAPTLAHRVVTRLEREGLLVRRGDGPKTTRTVATPRALAELWSQEEKAPSIILRGFLYGTSMETLARKAIEACPDCVVGGTLAANLYNPVLTTVAPPVRIWVRGDFDVEPLTVIGFQQTDAGANIEFVQTKGDPWRVHANAGNLPRVSKWRAWVEIANTEGRTQELAEALMTSMESSAHGSD
jgi:hypothetical protein